MVLIRLRHDDDDDTSPGGHVKIDCQGGGGGDDHGNGGGDGKTMANIMVFVMAMEAHVISRTLQTFQMKLALTN